MSIVITITGPSGSGKSTFESRIVAQDGFDRIRSTTTRTRRPGEPEDAYFFVSEEEFLATQMVESVEFSGARYGVSVAEIQRVTSTGKIPVIVCEPNGKEQIERWCNMNGYHPLPIFIDCPFQLRMERVLTRFIGSRPVGKIDFSRDEIRRLAVRIETAATEEEAWRDDNWNYSMLVRQYDEKSEVRAMVVLMELVAAAQKQIKDGKSVYDLAQARV